MKTHFLLILTLFALSISACKKEDPEDRPNPCPPSYYEITLEMEELDFLPETYWVYINDSTGVIDSHYVFSNVKDQCSVQYGCAGGGYVIRYTSSMRIKRRMGEPYSWMIVGQSIYWKNTYDCEYGGLRLKFGEGFSESPHYGLTLKQYPVLDSLPAGGNVFEHVQHFEITSEYGGYIEPSRFPMETYYFNEFGIVKYVSFPEDSLPAESWSLVRWNLVR